MAVMVVHALRVGPTAAAGGLFGKAIAADDEEAAATAAAVIAIALADDA